MRYHPPKQATARFAPLTDQIPRQHSDIERHRDGGLHMDNRATQIQMLKRDIAGGRLVSVVGTGVSVAATRNQEADGCKIATWPGLLLHGVKHCRARGLADDGDVELLNMQIDTGRIDYMIQAADTITKKLKSADIGVFRGWLKDNTVGRLRIAEHSVIDAVVGLPGVITTLNYDHLLEDASRRGTITWRQPDEVQDVLLGINADAVLHLHGSYRDPESVVLGSGTYAAVRDDAHAQTVLRLFTLDRTLLFIGCGDTVHDPNFTRLIAWARDGLRDVSPRHHLLCRNSELGKFQEMLIDAPWLQPLGYGDGYDDLAPFLRSLVPPGGATAVAKARAASMPSFDLTAYRKAMQKRYARLKLEALDSTTHDARQITLTGIFIPQHAHECVKFIPRLYELPKELQQRMRSSGELEGESLDDDTLEEFRNAYHEQKPRPILDVVRDPEIQRLVVLGDPGAGKSTLLQYLILDWADHPAPDPAYRPLPLLIELREYARLRHEGKTNDFLDYLHAGTSVRWHLDRTALDAWLKAQPSLILFDGLDEVFDPEMRAEVCTAINRFADRYANARVVVSSRIVGFQHQTWRGEGFRLFLLQELDEDQIAEFLARWHHDAYDDVEKGEKKRQLLAGAIADSEAIDQLARNPLLLTMMAILNRTQDLPRDRAELYEQCARLLLYQWKSDLAFAEDAELSKASLDFKDKRGLLLRIARTMQSSEAGLAGNLIDETTLEACLTEGLRGIQNLRPERASRALIQQLRGRNFMLSSVGSGRYAFVHRTFLEYFCAVDIREQFQTKQSLTLEQLKTEIYGHWSDETWHEVLCLLAGMLAPHFVAEILEWVITQEDADNKFLHARLAARCISEVRNRNEIEEIDNRINAKIKDMANLDFGFSKPDKSQTGAIITFKKAALDSLLDTWGNKKETLEWLITALVSGTDELLRAIIAAMICSLTGNSSRTISLLQRIAVDDKQPLVRWQAMEQLAAQKDHPESFQVIRSVAIKDRDFTARIKAIELLLREWGDDHDTQDAVFEIISAEKRVAVKNIMMGELNSTWSIYPSARILLGRLGSENNGDSRPD